MLSANPDPNTNTHCPRGWLSDAQCNPPRRCRRCWVIHGWPEVMAWTVPPKRKHLWQLYLIICPVVEQPCSSKRETTQTTMKHRRTWTTQQKWPLQLRSWKILWDLLPQLPDIWHEAQVSHLNPLATSRQVIFGQLAASKNQTICFIQIISNRFLESSPMTTPLPFQ